MSLKSLVYSNQTHFLGVVFCDQSQKLELIELLVGRLILQLGIYLNGVNENRLENFQARKICTIQIEIRFIVQAENTKLKIINHKKG